MTILLVGYYGYGNAGDEFLLHQTKHFLADTLPREPIVWFSKLKTFLYIPMASFVVFGGGGLLQNKTSNRSLYYYLSLLFFAKLCRKPIVLLSQGIGPISGRVSNWLTGYALSRCSFISVRDLVSYRISKSYNPKTTQSIDLSFYKNPIKQRSFSNDVGVGELASVFINIRSGAEWTAYRSIFQSIFEALEHTSYVIAQDGVDVSLANATSDIDLFDLFSKCDQDRSPVKAMMSMRYHGCVWAIINNIPCLALAYDEKIVQLALQFNLPVLDLRKTYSAEHVSQVVTSFLKESSVTLKNDLPFEDITRHFNDIQALFLKEVVEI